MTATELLMKAMEDFSENEPRAIVVIYTSEPEIVTIKTNTTSTHVVGMAEFAKAVAMESILKSQA